MFGKGSLLDCLAFKVAECKEVQYVMLFTFSLMLTMLIHHCFEKQSKPRAVEMDPVAIYKKRDLESKVLHLLEVSDYDAIRNLPDIANYIKNHCISNLFEGYSNKELSDPDTRDFVIWWIRHPNFRRYSDYVSEKLQTLIYENATEDVLKRNINYYNSHELILVAIKRSFYKLLKRCLWVQYTKYQKPVCYYANSQIYKLLTEDRYFDPKILAVYLNALNNINIPFYWNKLSLTQLDEFNKYKATRKELDTDSDEEISDVEDKGDSDD